MKVGDTVRWARSGGDPSRAAARYVLVEHDGTLAVIRDAGDDPAAVSHVRDVPLADLALAENAPAVVEPADD